MNQLNIKAGLNVRDYGACGVAVKAETQICPSRIHAGWNPKAELRRDIFRAPQNDPAARDTAGLQAGLDAAAANGGGTVVVPPGDYLTGPLWLRSNVHLHLEAGATLWGSPDIADYNAGNEISEKTHGSNYLTGRARDIALINATGEHNVTISGQGRINAQGGAFFIPWWRADKSYTLERPWRMFWFQKCEAITVQDISICDSCGWTLVFKDCRHVRVNGIRINNIHGPNVDGIDLENTECATISDCDIFTTDDGICLKSTRPDGKVRNVAVSNCNVRTLCNAFKIGTETLGTVEDVVFNNCTAYNREDDLIYMIAAIAVCCCDGAQIERIQFHNITARGCRAGFYMYAGKRGKYQSQHREPVIGSLSDVTISNFMADKCVIPSFICGHPESPVRNVTLRDLRIRGNFSCFEDSAAKQVQELPDDTYPDARMFGELPSHGLYFRHVDGLFMRNSQIKNANLNDLRPAIASEFVENMDI